MQCDETHHVDQDVAQICCLTLANMLSFTGSDILIEQLQSFAEDPAELATSASASRAGASSDPFCDTLVATLVSLGGGTV
jgi:hypothetical protein